MRIKIPFEKIYTSVFYVEQKDGVFLFDGGTDEEAAKRYILPVVEKGKKPDYLIASHSHEDHFGALPFLHRVFPQAKVAFFDERKLKEFDANAFLLKDGQEICGFRFLLTKGHSPDSLCAFNADTGEVYSFDSLQAGGAKGYGVLVRDSVEYERSVEKIRALNPKKLYLSHAFLPLEKDTLCGEEIEWYLDECIKKSKS